VSAAPLPSLHFGPTGLPVDRIALARRWTNLCRRLALTPSDRYFDLLWRAYTAPDRHYHNIRHIAGCLAELDRVNDECDNPAAIEMAIWFHDCVYDPMRLDNEERSAEQAKVALTQMGASDDLIAQVAHLILDTKHISPPQTHDGQVLVDIDLASLGQSPEIFDAHGQLIRDEYSHLDDATFDRGRIEMFERFLARPRLYFTESFSRRYETQARENLKRTLAHIAKD
jgi:predicted metal-dependent HD superfamily phosphohydrolase